MKKLMAFVLLETIFIGSRRNILLILMLSMKLSIIHSQDYLLIKGTIIDDFTKASIPYASISTKNNEIGTICNLQGDFVLKIQENYYDSIYFSHLTYYTKRIHIKDFNDSLIRLTPAEFVIQPINIWPQNPNWIIRKSMENISNNYYTIPMNFTGYYREIIKENQNKIQHLEAIIEIYKSSVSDRRDKDRLKINKGIVFKDIDKSLIWNYIKIVNSPYELISADIAKYPSNFISVAQNKINFLNSKHFKYYNYELIEKKYRSKNDQYIIHFAPKKKSKKAVYEGFIHIDKITFSIISLEYYFHLNRLKSASIIDDLTRQNLLDAGAFIKAIDFYSIINYKKYGNKYIMSHSNMGYDFVFVE